MENIELAKAYVQIVPSAKGIKGAITQELDSEAESSGKKAGFSIASSIKGAIIAAGIGKVLQSTIMEGANLEQSIGGVETMFKESADKIKNYAKAAYSTAGLGANEYMQQVTSFSASLIQSLGGDTDKAAESANQAILDMSDNANKMGTSIEMIQNAYQGFARGNYTMLDNLKLGYGGTKEEMQRLLEKASEISGIKYDINNLNDVYSAIHEIQNELGITGTTALEANTTVIGSFKSMKSSISNLLGNMALGENIKEPLNALFTTTSTFLFGNLLPMIGNVILSIPQIIQKSFPLVVQKGNEMLTNFVSGFKNNFPTMSSSVLDLIQSFGNWLTEQAPIVIQKGFEMLSELVDGIIGAIPVMIQKIPTIISTFANIINDNFPTILLKGGQLLLKFIAGILAAIPTLIQNIPQIIKAIVDTIMAFNWINLGKNIIKFFGDGIKSMVSFVKNKAIEINGNFVSIIQELPAKLYSLGKNSISNFGNAIRSMFSWIGGQARGLVTCIVDVVKSLPSRLLNIGQDMIRGLWNGISNMTGWILDKIGGFAGGIIDSVKNMFGIHSPSKVFKNEVGKNLSLGLAEGITDNLKPVDDAIAKLNAETMATIDTSVNVKTNDISSFNRYSEYKEIVNLLSVSLENDIDTNHKVDRVYSILAELLPELANMQIVTDTGVLVGEMIDKIDEDLGALRTRKGRYI